MDVKYENIALRRFLHNHGKSNKHKHKLSFVYLVTTRRTLAPVAETGFSHRLTAYKISLDCHVGKYRWIIRSKIVFFRISNISVQCPHAQLRGRTVIKKLWTFLGPWGRDRSQSPPCWIFWVKQIHQSTAWERATRLVGPGLTFLKSEADYWLIAWSLYWMLKHLVACSFDRLIDWLIDWLIDRLIDWLINWFIDWLID